MEVLRSAERRLNQPPRRQHPGIPCVPAELLSGISLSTDFGPLPQNPILAVIAPLLGGKKVLFPIPKHDQEMVRHLKGYIDG